ncbi:MAG: hypothetical protein KBH15_06040, partial [Candidatus Atribacteria bacterium]|nr:hypothetical protein [Candidatus Atribacteria bacterium]
PQRSGGAFPTVLFVCFLSFHFFFCFFGGYKGVNPLIVLSPVPFSYAVGCQNFLVKICNLG